MGVVTGGIGLVTRLHAEALLARRLGFRAACCGAHAGRAEDLAEDLVEEQGVLALVSFGVAGGLAPGVSPGTLVVPSVVMAEDGGPAYATDERWRTALVAALPGAKTGALVSVDRIVGSAAEKAALFAETAALAVDTESLGVAEAANRHGLPFIALRAICDPSDMTLPHGAFVGLTPNGRIDRRRVMAALLRRPWDLPSLTRLALASRAAQRALRRGANALAGSLP